MNPNPKNKRIKLKRDAYVKLVHEIWESQYRACNKCHVSLQPEDAHPHHKKSRGGGGDDSHENIEIICWKCHHKTHTGEIS